MIITVTLTPAVDRVVALGEPRLSDTNRVSSAVLDPGSKGIDVSRMIPDLGGKSLATGFVAGSLEKRVGDASSAERIPDAFGGIPGQTRLNLAVVEPLARRRAA